MQLLCPHACVLWPGKGQGVLGEGLAHAGWPCVQGDYDVIKTGECNNYRAHKEMKQREELAALQAAFTVRREELRDLVDKHNLRQADPLGEPL